MSSIPILLLLLIYDVAHAETPMELPGSAHSGEHPFIRVFAEELVPSAPPENLFLCPMNVTDGVNLTSWPSEAVTIDGTYCINYNELMEYKHRGDFLKCLTEVTNATTHALDMLGIDAAVIDGTLLGWQRHDKNHIPWDVDADLVVMQNHCLNAFSEFATDHHKNMASLLQEYLPDDSRYRVAGIIYGDGSELDPDDWEGCDARELRVILHHGHKACHVDVFHMLQSEPSGDWDCASCPGYDEGIVTVCRGMNEACALYDDFFPMKWDRLDGGDVKVPNKVHAALKSYFGTLDYALLNLREIPINYEFGSNILVVGRTLLSNTTINGSSSPEVNLRGSFGEDSQVDTSVVTSMGLPLNMEESNSEEKIVAANWPLKLEGRSNLD
ncbi:hypothetical protein Pmar_PMAR009421 [Perkinsus marinus ATCC 50983]|uniref:LicD/FKTN/FKRP nucleotidyltransferase domain-containing protein n=1 Tax=Perkinsus marinus (strain ATCC 50983 / TXsc) TaxID=423536 RepID=C5KL18_PERM5|nr:hypothetical protein Pmar_PMAR009421 [Perkinsus marinus ATCC 50983]EER14826.1 hypothetical protein Pmar_PMAR009421 [Perkinsus marinus ATCC 50983]|eukprot:XP_002783030.1 hypothetical protein Pmar_PMAR009421 [Perkinsus marinus ATCC 50983]